MYQRTFLYTFLIFSLTGCQYLPWGKAEAQPIFVGEPETIIVEPPEDAFDVSYRWTILDLPDASLLVPDFSSASNVFTFTADVEGDYAFSVMVESYGEDLDEMIMRYQAMEDTSLVPSQTMDEVATLPLPTMPPPSYQPAQPAPVVLAPAAAPKSTAKAKPKPAPKKAKVAKKKTSAPDVVPGHYTIQISSWKTAKQAHTVRQQLVDMGHDAYIQRVWLEDRQEVWWRVRMGDYGSITDAKKTRDTIAKTFSTAWVDNVRQEMIEKAQ